MRKSSSAKVRKTVPKLMKLLTASRAYQATCSASRTALSNSATSGVMPSNLLPFENRLEKRDDAWQFTYQGDDGRVVYVFRPATGTLDDFSVQVDEGRPFQPARDGAATAVWRREAPAAGQATETDDALEESVQLRGGRLIEAKQEGDQLHVLWEYDLRGRPLRITWTFGIRGKALRVAAQLRRSASSVSSRSGPSAWRRCARRSPSRTWRATSIICPFSRCSSAGISIGLSRTVRGVRRGRPPTSRRPTARGIRCSRPGYIAVSPDIGEVLPNIPHPPSPYLAALGPRIMLDIWGHHQGTYAGDAENLPPAEGPGRGPCGDHPARLAALRLRREAARPLARRPALRRRRGHEAVRPGGQRLRLPVVAARELHRPLSRRAQLRPGGPRAAGRRLAVTRLVQPGHARCRVSG